MLLNFLVESMVIMLSERKVIRLTKIKDSFLVVAIQTKPRRTMEDTWCTTSREKQVETLHLRPRFDDT